MEILYLQIAGFCLGVKLFKTEWPDEVERTYKRHLEWLYSGFIVDKPKKVDCWILIKNYNNFDFIKQPLERKKYICLHQIVTPKKYLTYYYISDAQFQLILREILQYLLTKHQGFIFHASAVKIQDKAFVFLGRSGAGKSTIARKLSEQEVDVLADDMLIIRKEKKQYFVYQTPFFEKNSKIIKVRSASVLGGLFHLKKAKDNHINKLPDQKKIPLLQEQLFSEKEDITLQMKYILNLAASFHHIYTLTFTMQNTFEVVRLLKNIL